MMRRFVCCVLVGPSCMLLGAAVASSGTVTTDFEFDRPFNDFLSDFVVGTGDDLAHFRSSGAVGDVVGAGFSGITAAYHSGNEAWMVMAGTGVIDFTGLPVTEVAFFGGDLNGAQSEVRLLSPTGVLLKTGNLRDGSLIGSPEIRFSVVGDTLADNIGSIEFALTQPGMVSIDDFSFTTVVPEPASGLSALLAALVASLSITARSRGVRHS